MCEMLKHPMDHKMLEHLHHQITDSFIENNAFPLWPNLRQDRGEFREASSHRNIKGKDGQP